MKNERVKVYGAQESPFSKRVEIALKMKGLKYEYVEEDLLFKSPDLLKYNPIYKKVPVFLHNDKIIPESLVILEYIDETWKSAGTSILPQHPGERASARFWAKFIDDMLLAAIIKFLRSKGQEEGVVKEIREHLNVLEHELKDKKFFGGERIGLVDIAATVVALWLDVFQEVFGAEILIKKETYPKLYKWSEVYLNCSIIKETLPSKAHLLAFYRSRFEMTNASK